MPNNQFSKYCSDTYKNGNIFMQNKYKWLCPCAENPTLYPSIKNDYRRDYQITKKILLEEQRLEENRKNLQFASAIQHYIYETNGNSQSKRRTYNTNNIENTYNVLKGLHYK